MGMVIRPKDDWGRTPFGTVKGRRGPADSMFGIVWRNTPKGFCRNRRYRRGQDYSSLMAWRLRKALFIGFTCINPSGCYRVSPSSVYYKTQQKSQQSNNQKIKSKEIRKNGVGIGFGVILCTLQVKGPRIRHAFGITL